MRKLICLLLLSLISTVAFAGEVVAKREYKGPSVADYEYIFYIDGKEIARQTIYKNMVIKTTGEIPDGVVKEYGEKGELSAEATYKEGKINGIYREYYYNRALRLEIPYKRGQKHGIEKEYDPHGNLESETPYENGKKEGVQKTYFDNGALYSQTPYKNDKREGVKITYYEDGAVLSKTPYKDDKLEGIKREYWENGNLKVETPFLNGEMNGEKKEYYENGQLDTIRQYRNWESEGAYKKYLPDGRLKEEALYFDGNVVMGTAKYYVWPDIILKRIDIIIWIVALILCLALPIILPKLAGIRIIGCCEIIYGIAGIVFWWFEICKTLDDIVRLFGWAVFCVCILPYFSWFIMSGIMTITLSPKGRISNLILHSLLFCMGLLSIILFYINPELNPIKSNILYIFPIHTLLAVIALFLIYYFTHPKVKEQFSA